MKKLSLLVGVCLLMANLTAQTTPAKKPAPKAKPVQKNMVVGTPVVATTMVPTAPRNRIDSASYAYGVLIATNLQSQVGTELNPDQIVAGLNAVLKNTNPVMTVDAANQCMTDYMRKKSESTGEKSRQEGAVFLANNKTRSGVMTTASGLQYEILKKGTGTVSPIATDQVQVHYHGTNLDGSVFDSSVERGEPIVFGLNQVIAGWTEGLQLMKEGDKFKFYIPANLAYGDQSPSPKIKAGSTLIFEVELFKVNPN